MMIEMRPVRGCLRLVLSLAVLASPLAGAAESPAPTDDTLVKAHGKTRVTLGDIRHTIENNVPPDKLRLFYAERKRISQHAGNVFVVHKRAEEAAARKLTPAEQRRVDEARIRVLSQIQLDHIVAQEKQPDYEAVAREQWQAHPERYQAPEAVHASHVLIAAGAKRDDAAALGRSRTVSSPPRKGSSAPVSSTARSSASAPSMAWRPTTKR